MSSTTMATAIDEQRRPSRFWRRFVRNRLAVVGAAILVILAILAIVGPYLTSDPRQQNVRVRLEGPSWSHPFGTDEVGRDILSRVINGSRISLVAGLASVAVGLIGGTILGVVAGYIGGRTGLTIMAFVDLLLALPAILRAITIAAR